jgi:phage-related protein
METADTPRAWFPVNREEGSRECLSRFTSTCDKVQCGLQPDDFKPMPTIGKGVEEIRIRDDSGIYRVLYTARFADPVFVLHAFEKKTQHTSQRDIAIAKARFSEMMRDRR